MRTTPFIKALFLGLAIGFTACDDDDDEETKMPPTIESPISLGDSVMVRNTLQTAADPADGGTGGAELPIEVIFAAPEGAFFADAIISDDIEFDEYLDGLYDIDLSENSIQFNLVAPANDPIYSGFFRVIETGTFDRYYLTFNEDHNIESFQTSDPAVNLRIESTNQIVVEIGEGWNFNPGSSFTITLSN